MAFLVYSLGRPPGNSVSGAGSEIIRRNLDLMWSQKCGGSTAGLVEQYWHQGSEQVTQHLHCVSFTLSINESAFLSQR